MVPSYPSSSSLLSLPTCCTSPPSPSAPSLAPGYPLTGSSWVPGRASLCSDLLPCSTLSPSPVHPLGKVTLSRSPAHRWICGYQREPLRDREEGGLSDACSQVVAGHACGRCLQGPWRMGMRRNGGNEALSHHLGGGQDIHFPTDDSGKSFCHFCEEQHRMGGTA